MKNHKVITEALYDAVKLYKKELDTIESKIEDNTLRLKRGYVDASTNLKRLNNAKEFYETKDKEVRNLISNGNFKRG